MARRNIQADREAWAARVAEEGFEVGQEVSAARVTTDSRDYITNQWWEPAHILEIRGFDALVVFADGTRSSSGFGIRRLKLSAELPDVDGDPYHLHFEVLPGRTTAAVKIQSIDGDYMTVYVDFQALRTTVAELG